MKTMKLVGSGLIMFLCVAAFLLTGCEPGGDDGDGGAGAEFDDTLYYTKTEVDGLIESAITDAVNQAETAAEDITTVHTSTIIVEAGDGPPKIVEEFGYASRNKTWTVPDGASHGVFRIEKTASWVHGEHDYLYIGEDEANYEAYALPYYNQVVNVIIPYYGATSLSAWIDADANVNAEFEVTCLFWLK